MGTISRAARAAVDVASKFNKISSVPSCALKSLTKVPLFNTESNLVWSCLSVKNSSSVKGCEYDLLRSNK